ncbi:MAG: ABC transporter permease [Myxococcaceae bacterium]
MNTRGAQTLFTKEVRRFLRVPGQTVFSPLVMTSLYFIVFGYSLGERRGEVNGIPYLSFIVPGLVFLGIANNAFLNASSSVFIHKIQGTLVDLLVAPLGPMELMLGFVGGAMVRGLAVGLLTWAVASFFVPFHLAHVLATVGFLCVSSFVFSVLGLLAGLWAEKFEQINLFPTFVMMPLTFLGGVFYDVRELPMPWRAFSLSNPMVYMVEGLRYGMLGRSTISPAWGTALLAGLAIVASGLAYVALRRGYKLLQ